MKKEWLMFILLMGLVSAPALAGQYDIKLNGGMGITFPTGDLDDVVDYGFSLRLSTQYDFTNHIGIRGILGADFMTGDQDYYWEGDHLDSVDTDLTIFMGLADLAVFTEFKEKFTFTGLIGLGVYDWDADVDDPFDDISADGTELGFNFGGAARYAFNKHMGVEACMLYHFVDFDDWIGSSFWWDSMISFSYIF